MKSVYGILTGYSKYAGNYGSDTGRRAQYEPGMRVAEFDVVSRKRLARKQRNIIDDYCSDRYDRRNSEWNAIDRRCLKLTCR